jgi:hypothetical protein
MKARVSATTRYRPNRVAGHTLEVSDDRLMKQVQDGSRDALALLFLKCARSVRNIAYRVLRTNWKRTIL